MAVLRQLNLLSQQRLDIPHLRSLESAVAADFDVLAGRGMAGEEALVLRGLRLTNVADGAPATSLQLATANSIVFNVQAIEAGTFLWVPSDHAVETLNPVSNSRVTGGWTSSAVNYVGLDFVRSSDATTTDLVQFLDANTLLETPKQVPLGRTLDYRIVLGTVPFTALPNLVPIAKVTLNGNGHITAVEDARPMMFRLGSGGDSPNKYDFFAGWTRKENYGTIDSTLFTGGDKEITSLKEWQDAAMTRMWELGGGEFWYSATADRNVNMVWVGAAFSNGENFEWDGTNLHWQGIKFIFDNSTGTYNDVTDITVDTPGLTDLVDGECVYADLDRTGDNTITAAKASLTTLGPGSVPGARYIMAWRVGAAVYTRGWRYPIGTLFSPATTTSQGVLKISRDYLGTDTPGASGLDDPIALSDRGGTIQIPVIGNVGLTIKRFDAGANILEWQEAGGTLLGAISNDGDIVFSAAARKIAWPTTNMMETAGHSLGVYDATTEFARFTYSTGAFSMIRTVLDTVTGDFIANKSNLAVELRATTNHPLDLYTNNIVRWRVEAAGNLVAQGGNRKIQSVTNFHFGDDNDAATASAVRQLSRRNFNMLANGSMLYWQRATTGAVPVLSTLGYFADRWGAGVTSASNNTISRQTATGLNNFRYCLRYQRDNTETDVSARWLGQEIDREVLKQHLADYPNNACTISFWARKGANFSGTLTVQVRAGDGAETNSRLGTGGYTHSLDNITTGTTTVALTTSWQQFTSQCAALSSSTAAVPTQAGVFFQWVPSGTAGANDYWEVTGLQLTPQGDDWPTTYMPFGGSPDADLQQCQRYYEQSCPSDVTTGTNTYQGAHYTISLGNLVANTAAWELGSQPKFAVEKWKKPSAVTLWVGATAGSWYIGGGLHASSTQDDSTISAPASKNGFQVINNTGGNVTPTAGYSYGEWAADAEFY